MIQTPVSSPNIPTSITLLKRSARLALLLAVSTALGGCGAIGSGEVGIDYKRPATPVPTSFQEGHAGPTTQPDQSVDLTQWWITLHDKELDSLIQRSMVGSLTLLTAEARVREARAQLGIEIGGFLPSVNLSMSASKSRTARGTSSTAGVGNNTIISSSNREPEFYSGGLNANWNLDIFGGQRRAIEAAADSVQAYVDARRFALVTLTANVAHDYVLLRGYQAELAITYSNLKSEQDTLKLTQSRFNSGFNSDLDVAQAQASVATTAAEVPTYKVEIEQEIHAISMLLGLDPMALTDELTKTQPIPSVPDEVPVGLPSELLRRRPDVRQAERQLASTTADIGVSVAALFPKISLTGSVGQQSSRFGLLARSDSTHWSVGPQLSWNIFAAGSLISQVRVSNALQAQALYNYKQVVLQSFTDVENALIAFAQDQQRTKSLQDEVSANQRAVSLSKQLYTRGLGDFLNVLTAERNLYSAQSSLVLSQSNVAADLVVLYQALGGGWDPNHEKRFQENEDPGKPVVTE